MRFVSAAFFLTIWCVFIKVFINGSRRTKYDNLSNNPSTNNDENVESDYEYEDTDKDDNLPNSDQKKTLFNIKITKNDSKQKTRNKMGESEGDAKYGASKKFNNSNVPASRTAASRNDYKSKSYFTPQKLKGIQENGLFQKSMEKRNLSTHIHNDSATDTLNKLMDPRQNVANWKYKTQGAELEAIYGNPNKLSIPNEKSREKSKSMKNQKEVIRRESPKNKLYRQDETIHKKLKPIKSKFVSSTNSLSTLSSTEIDLSDDIVTHTSDSLQYNKNENVNDIQGTDDLENNMEDETESLDYGSSIGVGSDLRNNFLQKEPKSSRNPTKSFTSKRKSDKKNVKDNFHTLSVPPQKHKKPAPKHYDIQNQISIKDLQKLLSNLINLNNRHENDIVSEDTKEMASSQNIEKRSDTILNDVYENDLDN